MRVSVFGLGYVGAVTAGCLADAGHTVVGVDVQSAKIDLVNGGRSPVIEERLDELIGKAAGAGTLQASGDAREGVLATELSLVCVGTPSKANGDLDVSHLRRVCEEIGGALKEKAEYHVVAIRSTILPGTMTGVVIPTLESASGKQANERDQYFPSVRREMIR